MRDETFFPVESQAEAAAELLAALANPKRLTLLCILLGQEMSVGDMAQRVGLSQSALSQHLARLRLQGLIAARRDGQSVYYSVSDPAVRDVIATLYRHFCEPSG